MTNTLPIRSIIASARETEAPAVRLPNTMDTGMTGDALISWSRKKTRHRRTPTPTSSAGSTSWSGLSPHSVIP